MCLKKGREGGGRTRSSCGRRRRREAEWRAGERTLASLLRSSSSKRSSSKIFLSPSRVCVCVLSSLFFQEKSGRVGGVHSTVYTVVYIFCCIACVFSRLRITPRAFLFSASSIEASAERGRGGGRRKVTRSPDCGKVKAFLYSWPTVGKRGEKAFVFQSPTNSA